MICASPAAADRHGAFEGSHAFLDPQARMFTLRWPDGALGRALSSLVAMASLPDGSVVLATAESEAPNLYRQWPDGHVSRMLAGGNARAVAVEPSGALLIGATNGRVYRLVVTATNRTLVADLSRRADFVKGFDYIPNVTALAALDNGELLASNSAGVWSLRPGTEPRPVALPETIHGIHQLTPLAGGRVLIASGDPGDAAYTVATTDGWLARLPVAECCGRAAALPDGTALLAGLGFAAETASMTIVAPDAGVQTLARSVQPHLGNGDGVPAASQSGWPQPTMTLAADGALVFTRAHEGGFSYLASVRAVVPPLSARARVAFTQSAFETFAQGHVGYHAPVAGRLDLEVRRGEKVVRRISGQAVAPEGALTVGRLAPAAYDLHLRLRAGGGGAEARARMDTRARVPIDEARAALEARYASSHGDEGGHGGYRVGQCRRQTPREVGCVLLSFISSHSEREGYLHEWPADRVTATLRPDGIATRTRT